MTIPRACLIAIALGGILTAAPAGASTESPPEDRLLPPERHMSPKGQRLAQKHASALRALNADVYYCLPWLEVAPQSIGFFKPREAVEDLRYLSLRAYIEQDPSPQFASLTLEERAAAMFSRYTGALLRRMAGRPGIMNDDTIDGFTVILEWLKQTPTRRARPVNETIAVFVEKVDADEYLGGQMTVRDLAVRTRVVAWDGDRPVGALRLAAWDDDFVARFRVKNYQPPAGVTCR